MKNSIFVKLLVCTVALCLALTAAHIIYDVYAYGHCSVIEFVAKELW